MAGAVHRWDPDPNRGRFRAWLGRIAHNQIVNALARVAPDRASGRSGEQRLIEGRAAHDGPDSTLVETEYRREVFHRRQHGALPAKKPASDENENKALE